MRVGFALDTEDDVIARRLYGNPFAWGVTLVVIGTVFLLQTVFGLQLPVSKMLPVAMVALGAYMLFDYVRRRKSADRVIRFDSRRPPPSVVATGTNDGPAFRPVDTSAPPKRELRPLPFERRF